MIDESTARLNFAENVKYLCKIKKITMQDLEHNIGITKGYVSRISEKKDIGLGKAYMISKLLEVDINDLIEKDMWREARIKELEAELAALRQQ